MANQKSDRHQTRLNFVLNILANFVSIALGGGLTDSSIELTKTETRRTYALLGVIVSLILMVIFLLGTFGFIQLAQEKNDLWAMGAAAMLGLALRFALLTRDFWKKMD